MGTRQLLRAWVVMGTLVCGVLPGLEAAGTPGGERLDRPDPAELHAAEVAPQGGAPGRPVAAPEGVQALVERFYNAYAQRDLNALADVWSSKSPERTQREAAIRSFIQAHRSITLRDLRVVKTRPFRELLYVRVSFDLRSVHVADGKPCPNPAQHLEELILAREGEAWKVWDRTTPTAALTTLLLAAASPEERKALMEGEEARGGAVLTALADEARSLAHAGKLAEALAANDAARELAGRSGTKSQQAQQHYERAYLFYSQSNLQAALESEKRSHELYREAMDRRMEMFSLMRMGDLNRLMVAYDPSLSNYQAALTIARELGDQAMQETIRDILGNLEQLSGKGELRPQLSLQTGHSSWVTTIAYSPDGRLLASGSQDSRVRIWDLESGLTRFVLPGHPNGVVALAFSPDNRILATGGNDGVVHLWDVGTGKVRRTLTGLGGVARGIFVTRDGTLVTATSNGQIRLYNPDTGDLKQSMPGPLIPINSAALSSDSAVLALGGVDGNLYLWQLGTERPPQVLAAPGGQIASLAFSPDNRILAAAGGGGLLSAGKLELWSTADGKRLRTLDGHTQLVAGVAFSRDGRRLLSVSFDGSARVWDPRTGELQRVLLGHINYVLAGAFSPDDRTIATGGWDNTVRFWDASGQLKLTLGHARPVWTAVYSSDGKTIVGGYGDRALRFWNAATGELTSTMDADDTPVRSLVLSPDQRLMVTGGDDGTVKVWGRPAAEGSWVLKRTLARTQQFGYDYPTPLALSPDARTLATGGLGGVDLWDSATLARKGHFDERLVETLAFSPDGKLLAGGGIMRQVRLWDLQTGKLIHSLPGHTDKIRRLAFSPDSKTLVSASWDRTARIWDVASGTVKRTLAGHPLIVLGATFSPDGKTIATSSFGAVMLWRAETGELLHILKQHQSFVEYVAFSPDGKRLVSACTDSTLCIWDPARGLLLGTLASLPAAASRQSVGAARNDDYLAITREGYYAGSASADRFVRFRLRDDVYPAESFQARYYRPDQVRRALAGEELPPVGEFKGPYPPLVAITTPRAGEKANGDSVQVTMETSDDSDPARVALFVNGARVDAKAISIGSKPIAVGSKPVGLENKPVPAAHRITRTFSLRVPLPAAGGPIRIQAIAYDEDGLQSPRDEVQFTRDAAALAKGRLLGLCVGVSRYEDTRLNLQFGEQDATALSRVLREQKGLYSAAEASALTDEQATRKNVLTGLDSLVSRATKLDTVIVFLSGHGWRDDQGKFYFATHEVSRANVGGTALPWNDILARLTALSGKSKRVLVLLDACHSGSAATNDDLVKALLGAGAGVLVFASSKGSEISIERRELGHGAFTSALLEAFGGKAASPGRKDVPLRKFIDYVQDRVEQLTETLQHAQVPFLQDFDTDSPIAAMP